MTQEERLQYCMICKNRKLDMQKGTICKLTKDIPAFEDVCPNIDTDANETLRQLRYEQSPENEIAKARSGSFTIFSTLPRIYFPKNHHYN